MKRIVLLGSSGFVGSNLRLGFLDVESFELACPSIEDVNIESLGSLMVFLQDGDIVINASGYANATDESEKGRELFHRINVLGLSNILKACKEKNAAQLIHLSSVAAMGRMEGLSLQEKDSGELDTPYAKSKREGETLCAQFMEEFPITILRPSSVFGEGRGLTQSLIKIVDVGHIPLPSGGEALVPLSYIGNLAEAVRLCVSNKRTYGKVFIVGDKQSYRLREVVTLISKELEKPLCIYNLPRVYVPFLVAVSSLFGKLSGKPPLLNRGRFWQLTHQVQYDIEAFVTTTGYQPKISLAEGIARSVKEFRLKRETRQEKNHV